MFFFFCQQRKFKKRLKERWTCGVAIHRKEGPTNCSSSHFGIPVACSGNFWRIDDLRCQSVRTTYVGILTWEANETQFLHILNHAIGMLGRFYNVVYPGCTLKLGTKLYCNLGCNLFSGSCLILEGKVRVRIYGETYDGCGAENRIEAPWCVHYQAWMGCAGLGDLESAHYEAVCAESEGRSAATGEQHRQRRAALC